MARTARTFWILGCIAAGLAVGSVAHATPAARGPFPARAAVAPQPGGAAADEALAAAEASSLLAKLALPPGAAASAGEPAGDGGYLSLHGQPEPWLVERDAWWTVPGTPAQLFEYIHARLPSEATQWTSAPPGISTAYIELRWPAGAGEIVERWLHVSAAQLTGGETGVLVESLVLWMRPRTPIPPGTRVLRVTDDFRRGPGPRTQHTHTITSLRRIARARALVDALPVARPTLLPMSCPASLGSVRLAFLPRSRAPALAVADVVIGGCGGVGLNVHGVEQSRLLEGGLLGRLDHALGLHLDRRFG